MTRTLVFILFLGAIGLQAQPKIELSDSARISLMTVAPGDMVYSTFGHSAIRVFDPQNRLDRCYNYGTFDFEQPNFLLKFCRGRLLYFLNVEPYRSFEYGNLYDRRPMREQFLNLDSIQRQRLFDLLQENALEENRYYKYDFFYDNCATRIRDIVKETFYHQITFDSIGLVPGTTMRQLLQPYLKNLPWTQFGIDLVLGYPADRVANAEDYMFLPDYVHDLFGVSWLPDGKYLVESDRVIPKKPLPARATYTPDFFSRFFSKPLWVTCLIAFLGLLSMANARTERVFDILFWFVLGVAGLIMLLLWVATDHSATKYNWNILWAFPTHLLFFWQNKRTEWVENYFLGVGVIALLTLIFWAFLPQDLPTAALPIAGLVVVKALFRRHWKKDDLE